MSQEDIPKKRSIFKQIFYYFRVDFTTIQGRLTGGFLSMALISFILIQGANYQWGLMIDNRNFIIEQIQPTKFFAAEVTDKVQEGLVAVEKAFLFNDEEFLKEYEDVWIAGVKANRDSLEKYASRNENNNVLVLFSKMDNQLANLKRELNQLKSIYVKRRQIVGIENVNQKLQKSLQTDVASIVTDIKKTSNEIINLQDNLEKEYDIRYAELEAIRPWIVALEFLIAVAIAATIGSLLILDILRRIRLIRDNLKTLSKGNIPKLLPETGDELKSMVKATNELSANLQEIKTFAIEVGEGRFDSDILVFDGQGELGVSLLEMKNSLKSVYEQEQLRAWATAGLAKFSDILRRNNDNIELLCNEIISETVKYLGINQGGVFVLNKSTKEPFLELKGMYAFDKKKSMQKQIKLGEGLLGQAFLEGGLVHIKQVPQDYIMLTSGLGNLQPRSLLIVPLQYNDEVIGVMELASFEDFQSYQIDFLRSIAEVTASTIITVYSNDATRMLLVDMQSKTQSIQEKEEQLRQNTVQLTSAQEELEKNLEITERELAKLKLILDSIADAVVVYSEKGVIQFANRPAENMFSYDTGELVGLSIRAVLELTPDEVRSDFAATRTRREGVAVKEARKVRGIAKSGLQFNTQIQVKLFESGKERLLVATLQNA